MFFDFEPDRSQVNAKVFEHRCCFVDAFFDQPKQNMLSVNFLMIESLTFLVGELHDFARSGGKS